LNLMPLNPNVKICTHIKVTGIRCGSPALRDEKLCYFHQRMIRGVPTPKNARIHPMALVENGESIQVALMETINAIVRNQIDLQRANLILRALSIAVRNSRNVHFDCRESEMVRSLPELQPVEAPASVPVNASVIAPAREVSAPIKEAGAPSLRPLQGWADAKPAAEAPAANVHVPRKPPGRVTSAAQAQAVNAPRRE
jgi:hypothetical protein